MKHVPRCSALLLLFASALSAIGPYNGTFVVDGLGLSKSVAATAPLAANAAWTMQCWVRSEDPAAQTIIAGFGQREAPGAARYFAVLDNKLALWFGPGESVASSVSLETGNWHLLAATFDGATAVLYEDGNEIARKAIALAPAYGIVELAPQDLPLTGGEHFAGQIADFLAAPQLVSAADIKQIAAHPPDFSLIEFEPGSKSWPVQTRAQAGLRAPQDPSTLPRPLAPFSAPISKLAMHASRLLIPAAPNEWRITGNWMLASAPDVNADPAAISRFGFQTNGWMSATVPGTVLTTLIDRGIYPDPDYGLNNLAIPESLNKHDYWYRIEFIPPADLAGRRLTLTFNGINYAASVWVNGTRVGKIKGAFIRGVFDATNLITPGKPNAIAVLVSPPPHPGIPEEESIAAGPGDNGGIECLDGPTFVDTEGWDWIPGIRDRDTGIWQSVTLKATGFVKIGDVQVVNKLPLPDISSADVSISVPLHNHSSHAINGFITASFEGANASQPVSVRPGDSVVALPDIYVAHPELWWPNGYGAPNLYHLKLSFSGEGESDTKTLRFGIREITYELSLLDRNGRLRRVEFSPTEAHGQPVVNITHEGTLQSAKGWVASLLPGAENSPAIHTLTDTRVAPYLVIRVNGVRIACRGGNWGMDDALKRVSRMRLEPYFRLERDAHLNIIRNWVGQNTEEVFYDLADEYGLLVWNDFWESTQNYNLEPSDTALFLANARDTILRFRNHPSIAIWCGRNEGVPSPAVNEGLEKLTRTLDGTRYYTASSNTVNLQHSGPYHYYEPSDYFTKFARGFAVELGTASMPTLEAFRAAIPQAAQWPPNDTWAYHDWHASGNGAVGGFMRALADKFGQATGLEDFERKAQLLNYVDHRAIFEGFNAHLWNPNSGRMLWMTHPSWPSTMWQIYSHDYDTQASYYGVKKASEPVHVQLNLPDLKAAVINNTLAPLANYTIRARVISLDGRLLSNRQEKVNAPAAAQAEAFAIALPPEAEKGVIFIKLELSDSAGAPVSGNFYWYSSQDSGYRALNQLAPAQITATAVAMQSGSEQRVMVHLANRGSAVALAVKLTAQSACFRPITAITTSPSFPAKRATCRSIALWPATVPWKSGCEVGICARSASIPVKNSRMLRVPSRFHQKTVGSI
jgi:hypothetical protein